MSNEHELSFSSGEAPKLKGRFWEMPDGSLVPFIAGGNDGGEPDGSDPSGGANNEPTGGAGNEPNDDKDPLYKEIKSARAEAAKYRRQLRELQAKVEGIDFDKYQELMQQQEEMERKKLEEKGKYEELLQEHQRRYEAQINKAQETINEWRTRYERQVVDNVLISAASNKAINPQEVVTLIRSHYTFQVNDQGEPEILDKDGHVVLDENGAPITPDNIMSKFLEERPYLCKPSGGGAGSRGTESPAKPRGGMDDANLRGASRIAKALAERYGTR